MNKQSRNFDVFVYGFENKYLNSYYDCAYFTSQTAARFVVFNSENIRHPVKDKCSVILGCIYRIFDWEDSYD